MSVSKLTLMMSYVISQPRFGLFSDPWGFPPTVYLDPQIGQCKAHVFPFSVYE